MSIRCCCTTQCQNNYPRMAPLHRQVPCCEALTLSSKRVEADNLVTWSLLVKSVQTDNLVTWSLSCESVEPDNLVTWSLLVKSVQTDIFLTWSLCMPGAVVCGGGAHHQFCRHHSVLLALCLGTDCSTVIILVEPSVLSFWNRLFW